MTFAAVLDESDIDHRRLKLGPPLQEPEILPSIDGDAAKQLRKEGGALIKDLRENTGLTQVDLAERLGYKFYTRVSQIERGIGRVPPEEFAAFADALGVEVRPFVLSLLRSYDPLVFEIAFSRSVAESLAI
ncbi:MAG: helix-turn-helix transcriptional regulator [Fulvimarina manganoxydans]|nr:helix-turn-helix transcriptional regulator [Fulvimarina manganoxydans]